MLSFPRFHLGFASVFITGVPPNRRSIRLTACWAMKTKGAQGDDYHADGRGYQRGGVFGIVNGVGFRQDFSEYKDEEGHD